MVVITEQAAASDTGRHRHANEDSFFVEPPVFVVADGMGGAQAGEVASKTAADTFQTPLAAGRPEELLRDRIETANDEIHRLAHRDPSLAGMGTTLTAGVLVPEADELVVGHVGDSRAYRLRGGELEQLTRDHSLVEEMRRKGQITDEQAETHPQRSIITRALGPEPTVQVDVQTIPVRSGDLFLLCSDGLTTMLDDAEISRHLNGTGSLEAKAATLVEEANLAGGRDNITVVLFRVGDSGEAPAAGGAPEHPTVIGESARAAGLDGRQIRRAAESRAGSAPADRGTTRRKVLRRVAKTAAALIVIAAVCVAGWWGARQVWFLGTDPGGRVALYQGLPYELPFGVELYSQRYSIPIQTAALPERRQEVVSGHSMRSRDDAVSLINDILASQATDPPGASP